MSWKGTRVQDLRKEFVNLYHSGLYTKVELCRLFDISRPTGDKWLTRYAPDDPTWANNRSRDPGIHGNKTPEPIRQCIIDQRTKHPTWGPKKLRATLLRQF